jgi:CDP-diglyceride synthetase
MPTVYKNAQVQGTAAVGTYATLYNTSASATAVISSILVANTASTAATYRIGIMGSAGTPGNSEWVAFGALVPANDTIALTIGVTLGNSQFVRVSSSANTVAFSAYISEIS